jgi:DNA-binding transcriptional regulator YiaG
MRGVTLTSASPVPDRDLIHAAMESTGLSARALAGVLAVDERTVRRWLAGERPMPGPAIQLCRALAHDPSLVLALGVE